MKFIIHVTISFKNKASSSLQSFQAEHKRQLLSLSFQIKLRFFSFFHPGHILGSHSALRTFLPQLYSTHNPTLVAADLTVQSIVGRYPNQPGSHTVPGKISTCAQHYWNTLQCTNLDLPKQVAPSKEPCAPPSLAVQLQERSVLLSQEGCAGLQLTGPARDPASLEGIPLQSGAKMFATGLGHGADRQQLRTAPMELPQLPTSPSPALPLAQASLQTERCLPYTPARHITRGMLWISWTCPGRPHRVCSAGLAHFLCLVAPKSPSVLALWPLLQPPQVFGRLFL